MNKVYGYIGLASGIVTSFFLYYYLSHDFYTSREKHLIYWLSKISVLAISVLFTLIAVKKLNGNMISFMRCMFSGFMISLISGLVNFAFFTVFYFTKPDIISRAEAFSKESYIESEQAAKQTSEKREESLIELHNQFTPGGTLLPTIFESFVFCMMATVFIAAFIYTRSKEESVP